MRTRTSGLAATTSLQRTVRDGSPDLPSTGSPLPTISGTQPAGHHRRATPRRRPAAPARLRRVSAPAPTAPEDPDEPWRLPSVRFPDRAADSLSASAGMGEARQPWDAFEAPRAPRWCRSRRPAQLCVTTSRVEAAAVAPDRSDETLLATEMLVHERIDRVTRHRVVVDHAADHARLPRAAGGSRTHATRTTFAQAQGKESRSCGQQRADSHDTGCHGAADNARFAYKGCVPRWPRIAGDLRRIKIRDGRDTNAQRVLKTGEVCRKRRVTFKYVDKQPGCGRLMPMMIAAVVSGPRRRAEARKAWRTHAVESPGRRCPPRRRPGHPAQRPAGRGSAARQVVPMLQEYRRHARSGNRRSGLRTPRRSGRGSGVTASRVSCTRHRYNCAASRRTPAATSGSSPPRRGGFHEDDQPVIALMRVVPPSTCPRVTRRGIAASGEVPNGRDDAAWRPAGANIAKAWACFDRSCNGYGHRQIQRIVCGEEERMAEFGPPLAELVISADSGPCDRGDAGLARRDAATPPHHQRRRARQKRAPRHRRAFVNRIEDGSSDGPANDRVHTAHVLVSDEACLSKPAGISGRARRSSDPCWPGHQARQRDSAASGRRHRSGQPADGLAAKSSVLPASG